MKTILLNIIVLFVGLNVSAQDAGSERQTRKALRKAHRDSVENAEYQLTKYLVENRKFVLEADFMANKTGNRVPVTSNLNFIKVDSLKVVLQTGRNSGVGANGLGGVTAEGSVSKWNVKSDEKNRSYYITMDVSSNVGFYTVFLDISSSGKATARLTGLGPGQLIWDGNIVPIQLSRVFKGKSI